MDTGIFSTFHEEADYQMICIWHPFECDLGLDGTLTSHIERVADKFDMACQSAI